MCVCTYECKPRRSGCSVIPCCKYRCAWCPPLCSPLGILLFILPLNFYRWGRFCCYKIFWSSALLNGKSAFTTAGRVYYKLCFLLLFFLHAVALFLSNLLNWITAFWQKWNSKHQCRLHFSQGQTIWTGLTISWVWSNFHWNLWRMSP